MKEEDAAKHIQLNQNGINGYRLVKVSLMKLKKLRFTSEIKNMLLTENPALVTSLIDKSSYVN